MDAMMWTGLVWGQNWKKWRATVSTIINLRVTQNARNFLENYIIMLASGGRMASKAMFRGPALFSSSVLWVLMTTAETVLETLLYPQFNHLMRLLTLEYFT